MTLLAGDLVVADFPGAVQVKRRPAVVLSTPLYHQQRPDVVLGLITGNIAVATSASDHLLIDWKAAGLHRPSAFRSYLITIDRRDVIGHLGRLSNRDWKIVQEVLRKALQLS